MSFIRKAQQTVFELTPAGNHPARCYRIVDLGMQQTPFKDKDGNDKFSRVVQFGWQLTGEKMLDGRPFAADKQYTDSLNEKANLRKMLESYLGKKFSDAELAAGVDYSIVLDMPCLLNIVHTQSGEKTYANVQSVSPIPKAMKVEPLTIKPYTFDIGNWNQTIFDGFHDHLKNRIMMGKTNMSIKSGGTENTPASSEETNSFHNDDIPF